jgi:predicted RNA-binding protein with PIN domain
VPYLIDGNNLLGSWGGPAVPGDGRLEVVRRVSAFCRAKGARATIVFDGAPFRAELTDQHLGAVTVRFPGQGLDADSVIRAMLDEVDRPGDWIVVTSDKAVYSYARTRGARALSAREWNELGRREGRAPRSLVARDRATDKPDRETDVEGWLKRFSGE